MSITHIDANGRVMLPIGIRFKLDLEEGDELAIDCLGDGTIILKKVDTKTSFDDWLEIEETQEKAALRIGV
jgi:AbrB family looped-hinge helix DNA binding protein